MGDVRRHVAACGDAQRRAAGLCNVWLQCSSAVACGVAAVGWRAARGVPRAAGGRAAAVKRRAEGSVGVLRLCVSVVAV